MTHECQFILGKKRTILVSDLYNGGGYTFVGSVGVEEISVPSSRFCFNPKTALKTKVFKKKWESLGENLTQRSNLCQLLSQGSETLSLI